MSHLPTDSPARREIWFEVSVPAAPPIQLCYMMSALTVHCQWEVSTVRKRTGHPTSCAEVKKMKSLTLHIPGLLFFFLVLRDMLNKFHLRYTAFVMESRDWRSSSFRDLVAIWNSPGHRLMFIFQMTYLATKDHNAARPI